MSILVLSREGLSGNYIKALIDDISDPVGFRIDPWYPGIYDNLDLSKLAPMNCRCLHRGHIDIQKALSSFNLVLSIQVYRKIYHGIYNNFYKKLLVEQIDLKKKFLYWHLEPGFWFDIAFYNIKEYYHLFRSDYYENPVGNLINFDLILDLDYIEEIFKQYLGRSITKNTQRIVRDYRVQQLQYDLSADETRMEDIIDPIPDDEFMQSPWFAAYCIFKYETNNALSEIQRLWSIDDIPGLIDKQTLLNICMQYRA